jgi:hypothetical protein
MGLPQTTTRVIADAPVIILAQEKLFQRNFCKSQADPFDCATLSSKSLPNFSSSSLIRLSRNGDKKTPPREGRRSSPNLGSGREPQLGRRLGDDLAQLAGPCIEHRALSRHPGLKGEAVDGLGDDRLIVAVLILV